MAGNGKTNGKPLDLENESPEFDEQSPEAGAPEMEGVVNPAASEFEAELEKLRTERDQYLDRLARLQAEFDNYRKRSTREQQEYRDYALADALKSFLPILDSLDRAAKSGNPDAETFRSGVELIDRQFHDALAKLGVKPVEAAGAKFDPNLHQAVQVVDTDEAPDNTVIDEMQRGYTLKDRLLRPAMVRVASNPDHK
jgi:molecular chaperone GrpE